MDELANKRDLEELLTAISKIPTLGTIGIISAVILLILLVGTWIYIKRLHLKISSNKNITQSSKDQAQNQTENEAISDQWANTHQRLESLRKEAEEKDKIDPPNDPGGPS